METTPVGTESIAELPPPTAIQMLGALASANEHELTAPIDELPEHLQLAYSLLIEHGPDRETVRELLELGTTDDVYKLEAAVYLRVYRRLAQVVSSNELAAIQQVRTTEAEAQDVGTMSSAPRHPGAPNPWGNYKGRAGVLSKPAIPSASKPRNPGPKKQKSSPNYVRGAVQEIDELFRKHQRDAATMLAKNPRLAGIYEALVDKSNTEADIRVALAVSPTYFSQLKRLTMETLIKKAADLLAFPLPESAGVREKWKPRERLRVLRIFRVIADSWGIQVSKVLRDDLFERYLNLTDPERDEASIYEELGDKFTTDLARSILRKLVDRLPEGSISLAELRQMAAYQSRTPDGHKPVI